jgi:hypothetical protein
MMRDFTDEQIEALTETLRIARETIKQAREELLRLHSETETLRAALEAALAWAAPMADAPKSSRPAWFNQARAALLLKGSSL